MSLMLTSPAFDHNSEIPIKYTCDGDNVSPDLVWFGIPDDTKSLALILDDPDAPDPSIPDKIWVLWILYNIPPSTSGLPEAIKPHEMPPGTLEGLNDWNRTGYGGPCPTSGEHRYFHKLYALDVVLPDLERPDKARLENAMRDHILETAALVGTYQR